ncbi:MAG: MBG domain-containing protein [Bacteroidia bacterium]|nr:MBG domain-containing protein [Bacteroidia bacterium]
MVLTTNLTLPEPGIPLLLSPPQDAVIGSDYSFEWAESAHAASYTLLISHFSDLGGATSYSAGSNLTYDITGLTLDATYYWGVFATNATGTTWCEIEKFTTSSDPPLAAVPQTIYVEQSQEKTTKLQYTGGDESAKTAIITALPAQGQLYQYNAGVKGDLISAVSTTVTDAERNVIYLANGSSGNGAGNFSFKIHEDTDESLDALVTVNVSPPGIPNLLYTAKNTNIELQFDRIMADPAGKQSQFAVTVNGTPATINSLSLKPGDLYSIIVILSTPLAGSDVVFISYPPGGDVASAKGGWLASFTDQSVTLTAQTITFTQSLSKKYSDSPFTLTATASSGLGMTYSSSNMGVATALGIVLTFHALGTSDITARQLGNGTYAPARYIRTLTVDKGDQTISFNVLPDMTYGDPDYAPAVSASSLLSVSLASDNTAVATIVSGKIHIVGAGNAEITASQAGNTLWNPAVPDVQRTLNVDRATLTVTADDKTRVYGDPNPPLTFTYSGFVNSENESVLDSEPVAATTADATTDAGTVPITVSGGSDNNYSYTYVSGTLTITKATATITLGSLTTTYNGLPQAVTATTSPTGLTVDFTYNGSATVPVNADSYAVIATINDINYQGTASGTLTINKATLTVIADDKTKVYGDPNPPLTFTCSGFVNSENESVLDSEPVAATTADATTDAGTVPITVSGGSDNNYSLTYVSGTLTITKATATVTPGSLTTTYNGLPQAVTATTSPTGLTVDFTYDGSATVPVNAGSYAVIATIDDINYQGTASGTLIINKADQTITFNALPAKVFGDADFSVGASASSALAVNLLSDNNAVATVVSGMIHITGAGTAVINASQAGDGNYNPAPVVPQTLTVNKANLTFTADDKSKVYQAQNPVLTYIISGFVIGETQSVLDVLPTIQTTAVQNSPVGSYPITITGGSDNNYNYIYLSGTLTVTKIPQTITFTDIAEKLLVEDSYTLIATSTSGLTVLFESMDTQKATVSGDLLTGVSKGAVQIRAYNPGDENFDPAEAFATVEIYSTHKDIMHLFTPNNDGFNDLWELPELATWGKCDVKVYNRWGKLVFADADYNNQWDGTSNGSPLPEGPYYFVIKTENAGAIKGTVNIIR